MSKKTAVDWIIEELRKYPLFEAGITSPGSIWYKAKLMEKQQIMNAYKCGRLEINRVQHDFLTKEEKHYDETYNFNSKFQLKK